MPLIEIKSFSYENYTGLQVSQVGTNLQKLAITERLLSKVEENSKSHSVAQESTMLGEIFLKTGTQQLCGIVLCSCFLNLKITIRDKFGLSECMVGNHGKKHTNTT